MSDEPEVIPINALFGEFVEPNPELPVHPRELLNQADVIIGQDVMSQREFIVYGKATLTEIIDNDKAKHVCVIRISLDQETDELEKLLALVQKVKGHHDYDVSPDWLERN